MVQRFKSLDDAIELARYAHRHQEDRAGMPYFDHPLRVMRTVQGQGARPFVQVAAILHDVSEDTAFSIDILRSLGFSPAAVHLVSLVDRDYSKNVFSSQKEMGIDDADPGVVLNADRFYYQEIAKNPDAKMIKLADIEDNLQPWRQSYLPETDQTRLQAKYAKAKRLLGVTE